MATLENANQTYSLPDLEGYEPHVIVARESHSTAGSVWGVVSRNPYGIGRRSRSWSVVVFDPQAFDLDLERELLVAAGPERVSRPASGSSPWAHAIGPVYSLAAVVEELRWSERDVLEQVEIGTVLGVRTGDGELYFPTAQFAPQGGVVPGVKYVLDALSDAGIGRFMIASWFNHESLALGGRTPWQELRIDGLTDRLTIVVDLFRARLST